jgi:poly-gamma-glutamate capsule biosynthesis protein CapA/YwtB (metallophosphatase superfamily)
MTHRTGRIRLVVLFMATLVVATFAPAAHSQEKPRSFTILAAGDILVHGRVATLAAGNAGGDGWDFWPMLQDIEPWVSSADFSICALESVLSSTNTGLSYYPRFVVPNQIADAVAAAGWDACSTATNHGLDGGMPGIAATLDELDERGIGHSGTARTPDERLPSLYDVEGVTIAHLAFSEHYNGLQTPADMDWGANVADVDAILADARWAREQGAEFVVLSISWGREYTVDPTPRQQLMATEILSDGAVDLILGHHAHVVQPIGMVDGRYVVYGMGNHMSNQQSRWGPQYYATEDGITVIAHVAEQDDGTFATESIEVVPTWVRLDDLHVFAAQDARSSDLADRRVLTDSIERTWERVTRLDTPGVWMADDPFRAVSCEGRRATILGTQSADTIVGTDGDDVVVARGGDDVIHTMAGDDVVCAGAGDDEVDAGYGVDRVWGGEGNDRLEGASMLDALFGGPGDDLCATRAILALCERST